MDLKNFSDFVHKVTVPCKFEIDIKKPFVKNLAFKFLGQKWSKMDPR